MRIRDVGGAVAGAVGVVVALAVGTLPVLAASADGQLGGPVDASGIADDTLCPTGTAVTGVMGEIRIIGGFIPIVATATVDCSGGAVATGTMGSGTGAAGATSCAAGEVAVGITGREGDFDDFFALRCQSVAGTGPITTSAGFGGPYGTADGPYECQAGTVLTGLRGQSVFDGSTIRYVEIVCGVVILDADGDGIADTSPPVDKAQCRDGGWMAFNNPSFKNQGQCVSYVATRA